MNPLHILLSIQEQTKQCAQEMLCTLSRDGVNYVSLEFLRSEIVEGLWEGFCESGAKHDDELRRRPLALIASPNHAFWTCKAIENATIGLYTHSNIRIICQDVFMRRGSFALRSWRRSLFGLRCGGRGCFGKELQYSILFG